MSGECNREREILEALRSKRADSSITGHLVDCDSCRDAAIADEFVLRIGSQPLLEHPLPDPRLLWLKAQLLQRKVADEKLTKRFGIVQMWSYIIIGVAWMVALAWKWPVIASAGDRFSFSYLLAAPDSASAQIPFSLLYTFAILVGLTLLVTFQTALAEE